MKANLQSICIALAFVAGTAAPAAQAADLNGCWVDSALLKYYVRQVNSEVWWLAEQSPVFESGVVNVAHGKITGKSLMLTWADVPKGLNGGSGVLVLDVAPDFLTMKVVRQGGGYGQTQFSRSECQ